MYLSEELGGTRRSTIAEKPRRMAHSMCWEQKGKPKKAAKVNTESPWRRALEKVRELSYVYFMSWIYMRRNGFIDGLLWWTTWQLDPWSIFEMKGGGDWWSRLDWSRNENVEKSWVRSFPSRGETSCLWSRNVGCPTHHEMIWNNQHTHHIGLLWSKYIRNPSTAAQQRHPP